MQLLMEILLRLLDLFCWLCTKRENVEQRLKMERSFFGKTKRGEVNKK